MVFNGRGRDAASQVFYLLPKADKTLCKNVQKYAKYYCLTMTLESYDRGAVFRQFHRLLGENFYRGDIM